MAKPKPDTPEFHIVVKRPNRRGPIAPYRFAITVVFSLAIAGVDLWNAGTSGDGVDDALIRTAICATFAWFLLGRVNAILKSAEPPPALPVSDADDPAPIAL